MTVAMAGGGPGVHSMLVGQVIAVVVVVVDENYHHLNNHTEHAQAPRNHATMKELAVTVHL